MAAALDRAFVDLERGMASALWIIRGEPGRWSGVAADSGFRIEGVSFAQVRQCLAEVRLQPAAEGASIDVDAALRRLAAQARRGRLVAGHCWRLILRRLGFIPSSHESHLIRSIA